MVLLAWGSIDQVRYYLALHQESLADLQRAAELNSYDSAVQTHLGLQELKRRKLGRSRGCVETGAARKSHQYCSPRCAASVSDATESF